MLSDESLDRFLDDFLSDRPATEAITIHKEKRRKADIIEEEITIAPPKSHKLPKRTVASLFLILFLIPLTIWFGMRIGDRKYMFISLMIVAYTMIPFFMVFEGRKPQARELVALAVLSAIAVAGRAAFFMLPQFKPLVAIVIIAGIPFGAESRRGDLDVRVEHVLLAGSVDPVADVRGRDHRISRRDSLQKGKTRNREVPAVPVRLPFDVFHLRADHEHGFSSHVSEPGHLGLASADVFLGRADGPDSRDSHGLLPLRVLETDAGEARAD